MIKNIERLEDFYYAADMSKDRVPGISAICRCKNEQEFIIPSLLSVKDFFDEIIIVFNNSTDYSEELVRKLNLPNVKIFQYPFDIVPAGPDNPNISPHSIHSIVHYTNFCISKSNREWIHRMDLDTIAFPSFSNIKEIIKSDIYNSIEERHLDLVGINCDQLGSQEMCSFEKRLIRIRDNVRYILSPNNYAEQAYCPGLAYKVDEPTFCHMRWCLSNPGKYWKQGWQNDPHFKAILERHAPVKKYEGELPQVLIDYLKLNKNPYKLINFYKENYK